MEYEKIDTIWKRDVGGHQVLIGEYSRPEFEFIQKWEVTEKVDGTNLRVEICHLDTDSNTMFISFFGRTDKAQIPEPLKTHLKEFFTEERLSKVFDMSRAEHITLYLEGYGAKIQKGGGDYISDDQSFILFDINIDGIWLEGELVTEMAKQLEVKRVPVIGIITLDECVRYVATKPKSIVAEGRRDMEGIVCRSNPILLDRMGERIITKFKLIDIHEFENSTKKCFIEEYEKSRRKD